MIVTPTLSPRSTVKPRDVGSEMSAGVSCRGSRTSIRWTLPHDEAAAGAARHVAREALEAWGMGEDHVHRALLVVSELVTNAVEHALPPVALRIKRPDDGDTVRVAVDDGGAAEHPGAWVASCAPDEHGRGNLIVSALVADQGVISEAGHVTHWAAVPAAA